MRRRCALSRTLASLLAGLVLGLGGCGGGGSSSSTTPSTSVGFPASAAKLTDPNVVAITVESGPQNNVNIPYVSVTVCTPGSTNTCRTIDHVMVDTGSIGLRLFASQVTPFLTLPAHQIGLSKTISECAQFLNTLAWGSIKLADIAIGGERAASVPVQLMDTSFPSGLSTCGPSPVLSTSNATRSAAPPNGTAALSANGILGVGLFASDKQTYFNCASPNNACELKIPNYPTALQQVQNPVSRFASSNTNGVIVQLPAIGAQGVGSASGYLIFGVGTQTNNSLGSANVLRVSRLGQFTTLYGSNSLAASILDSGSNGLYFDDSALAASPCSALAAGFYCPGATTPLRATIQLGGTGGNVNVDFAIANADNLFTPGGAASGNFAFSNLGGSFGGSAFDWGLPFFFGRSVYTVIEGKTVGSGAGALTGPFNAFTN